MIIYFIRHGETTGDVESRYGGDYDDHLTELGKRQAAEVAEQLSDKKFDALYASPLLRAQETAGILGKKFRLQPSILPGFKERNRYGILTGMTKDEAKQKYPDQAVTVKNMSATIDGAESFADFRRRITEALQDLTSQAYNSVAVVTHGGPLRFILSDILKLGDINLVDVGDCGFVVLEADGKKYQLLEKQGVSLN